MSRTIIPPSSILDADVHMEDTTEIPEPSIARPDTRTEVSQGSDTVANTDPGNGGAHSSDVIFGGISGQSDDPPYPTPPSTVVPTHLVVQAHRKIAPTVVGSNFATPMSTSSWDNPLSADPNSSPIVQANLIPGITSGVPLEKGITVTGISLGNIVGPPLGTAEHSTIRDQPSATFPTMVSFPGLN